MKKKKEKKKLLVVVAGFDPGTFWLRNSRLTTELPKLTTNHSRYKICIYIQYGVSDQTTFDLCNPTIPILIKKTLSNA